MEKPVGLNDPLGRIIIKREQTGRVKEIFPGEK